MRSVAVTSSSLSYDVMCYLISERLVELVNASVWIFSSYLEPRMLVWKFISFHCYWTEVRSWVNVARNFNTITFVCSSVALLYGLWRILEKSKYAEWSKRRIVKHLYFIKVKVAWTIYVQQNCVIIYHQFSRIFYLNINFCKQCQEGGKLTVERTFISLK